VTATLALALAAGGLSACGSDDDADFRSRAASLCTEVANDHLVVADAASPVFTDRGIDVIRAIQTDEEPSPEQIAEWADTLQAGIDRHAGIRDALAELSSGDETEQTQWEQIVTGSEGELEILRHRLAVLQTGDWEQISQDFLTDDGTQDPPVDALDALDLRSTDCEWIYLPTTVEEGSEEFVRAATTACTHISNRRSTTGFRTDAEADFDIFLTVFSEGDPAEVSEETVDAVERVHQEWERTVEDLEAVDASGAPDRDAWERSLQRVRERAHLTGDRAGALRAADADTISAAYGTDRTTSGSLDLEALGLQHRSCAGVSG